MPHYFFDLHGSHTERDEDGTTCDDLPEAAEQAKRLLPAIALGEIPSDGDRQTFTVLVTDEEGHPVSYAALVFVGTWLLRERRRSEPGAPEVPRSAEGDAP